MQIDFLKREFEKDRFYYIVNVLFNKLRAVYRNNGHAVRRFKLRP